jgi:hypothetical protein
MFKHVILFALCLSTSSSFAASFLTQLPFGIKIGQTTNKEIEDRGVCTKKIQVSNSYFRCENYSMAGGKFSVSSSENEIVSNVFFSVGHILPLLWTQKGIKLANKNPSDVWDENQLQQRIAAISGTNIKDFQIIIEENGAQDIHISTVSVYDFNITKKITFYIDNYFYSATFYNLPANKSLPEKDLGLSMLSISESY